MNETKEKKKVTKAIDNSVPSQCALLYAAHFASTARFTAEYKKCVIEHFIQNITSTAHIPADGTVV